MKTPLMILQGKQDGVVRWQSVPWLLYAVQSDIKILRLFERSSHYLYLKDEKERVYDEIDRFMKLIADMQQPILSVCIPAGVMHTS